MIDHNISIFEADTPYTQGFLFKPVPMLVGKMPSDVSWALEQALEIGLTIEEGNYRLFLDAQRGIKDPGARRLLKELAEDVHRHKEQMVSVYSSLLGVFEDGGSLDRVCKVMDLGVTDYLKARTVGSDSTCQDVLIFAAKREKIGYDFFSIQAGGEKDGSRRIWERFAELKLRQKQRIEIEYDEVVLREN